MAKKKQNWYRKTEAMLYDYKHLPGQIKEKEREMEAMMPQDTASVITFGTGSGGGIKNSTEKYGIKRATCRASKELQSLKYQYDAIRDALELLTFDESQLYCLKYQEEKGNLDVSYDLAMSERNYYRFKKKFIVKVAKSLGLLRVERL